MAQGLEQILKPLDGGGTLVQGRLFIRGELDLDDLLDAVFAQLDRHPR